MTLNDRQARANKRWTRLAARNLHTRVGAPVRTDDEQARVHMLNERNRWKQHGHPDKPLASCEQCVKTSASMTKKGTV